MKQNQIVNNAKWIIVCKAAQSLLQLVVGMLCARYLGPDNFGLISYAKAVVSFVLPVTQLGMDATLVKEFIDAPGEEGKILGTGLLMQLLSGLASMGMVFSFVSVANPGDAETMLVCVLHSLSLLFQALGSIQYWYQSKLQSKYPSIMLLVSYVILSAYKLFLLASGKSVYWFAMASSVEFGVQSIGLLMIYRRLGAQPLSVSLDTARQLFSRSKFYIPASLMVVAYQNTDHIMLTTMLGEGENGLYSAAITTSIVVQFVYYAIMDSAKPAILAARQDPKAYHDGVARLFSVILYLALAQSAVFTLLAKPIMLILYGKAFLSSVPVLRILVWYLFFNYIGVIRNIWILAEEKHDRLWIINLCGVFANVILNALFIPRWGACGAAFASVITQFFTNVVVSFLMKDIRPLGRILLTGLNPKFALQTFRQFLSAGGLR